MRPRWVQLGLLACMWGCGEGAASPPVDPGVIDVAELPLLRVYGPPGSGERGTPIAGGKDIDGDGNPDFLVASFLGTPPARDGVARTSAGIVAIVFGDGGLTGEVDASVPGGRVVHVHGENLAEMAGNEIWLDDVTGDGLADVLVGRQNFASDLGSAVFPGAVSVIVGGPPLRSLSGGVLELAAPAVSVTTLVGDADGDRLGVWFRSGDMDGDGVADLLLGADQVSRGSEVHQGAAYAVRGGSWLAPGGSLRLAELPGENCAALSVQDIPAEAHFGASCQLADLDADGHGDAIVAATIERAGAGIPPDGAHSKLTHPSGGVPHGAVWFFSGAAIAEAWLSGSRATQASGSLVGDEMNVRFGEEILGLGDVNGDAEADLFLGDIIGNGAGEVLRPRAGTAHVVFSAGALLNGEHQLATLRESGKLFEVVGAQGGDITGDTAAAGDFDGDGVADVAIASPHASRSGRSYAGMVHVIYGGQSLPVLLDLGAASPPKLRWDQLLGAHGNDALGQGDILGYSAASADLDGDGTTDLMLNEMTGDGPAGVDTGNLVIISGRALRSDP